ncbi:MAG: hypothetical protein WCD42_11780 [Rhizomicrobium sp.]
MTDQPRKIAFFSYYGHQKRFFATLAAHVPASVTTCQHNVYAASATPGFLGGVVGLSRLGNEAPTETITAFSFKKYLARHPGTSAAGRVWIKRFQTAKARAYYGWAKAWLSHEKPDLLVLWNGLPLPVAAAAAAARSLNIACLFCENGTLPKTVAMDPDGVNAASSLARRTADFYRAVEPAPEKLASLIHTPLVARALNPRAAAPAPTETLTLPESYVFLPLQVHDDSQILMYSPRFADMPAVVRAVAEAVGQHNQTHGTALKIVVKEHPSDYGRIDYSALRREFPDLLFTQTFSTAELIAGAKAVITVNSTVGIEALLSFKPVVTLGDAFFNIDGVVRHLRGNETLSDALSDALAQPPDKELIGKFLYHLRYHDLVAYDRRDAAASPAPAVARLLQALEASV